MAVGPKTRRYILARENPTAALMQQMGEMDGMVSKEAREEAQKVVGKLAAGVAASLAMLKMDSQRKFQQFLTEFEDETRIALKKKIDSLPHLKGADGYNPKKGVDYFDGLPGTPGDHGLTPRAGVDYPTIAMMDKYLGTAIAALYTKLESEGMSKKQIKLQMDDMFKSINADNIARALEALSGNKKLSYNALKDTPSLEAGNETHTLHRGSGSGKQTYEYDLSDQCNGVLKIFTIPTNTRVVLVQSTDAPMGIYRKTTDWTGSGTTTLTLTAAVAAPSAGATFNILYVV